LLEGSLKRKKTLVTTLQDDYKTSLLTMLIEQNVVDVAASNNLALRTACQSGNREVVQRLLQDARVDPTAAQNHALRCACVHNHAAVVADLLEDHSVDPSSMNQAALQDALSPGEHATKT
jgi:hypothetical protein